MKTVILEMFAWPQGIVVGNLIASAITTTIGVTWLHIQARRHHKEHMKAVKKSDDSL